MYLIVLPKVLRPSITPSIEYQETFLEEDDIGRFLGDVDRRVDRDADIGFAERAGVVDAIAHEPHGVSARAQCANDAHLVVRREFGEHDATIGDLADRAVVESGELAPKHNVIDRQSDVAADLPGDEVVVASEDLHGEAMVAQGSQCRRGGLLWRIEKADESRERELRLVGHRVRAVALVEISIRHRDDAEPVLVQIGNQLLGIVGPLDGELGDEIFVVHAFDRPRGSLRPRPCK